MQNFYKHDPKKMNALQYLQSFMNSLFYVVKIDSSNKSLHIYEKETDRNTEKNKEQRKTDGNTEKNERSEQA